MPGLLDFKLIELSDYNTIEEYLRKFPPYNDFEFMSLWTYNFDKQNRFSFVNGNLAIKIQDFLTNSFFYSFLGTNEINDTVEKLIELSITEGYGNELFLIPESCLGSGEVLDKKYQAIEDRASFDYILSSDEISSLEGAKYHEKRNLANRFAISYPDYKVEILQLNEKNTQLAILELFNRWKEKKGKSVKDVEIELAAIKGVFDLVDLLQVQGVGVYENGVLIGFSILHRADSDYAILSFEKCDTSYKGIYEFLNRETARLAKKIGCRYINYEQDLGIEGLRKSKSLWRPASFLKKFTIKKL